MPPRWRKTALVDPDGFSHADDWTFVADDGKELARLWNTEQDDLLGSWRWHLRIGRKLHEGSAVSGSEARFACERLLARAGLIEPTLFTQN